MRANPSGPGGFATYEKWWLVHYTKRQRDKIYIANPFGCAPSSLFLISLKERLERHLCIDKGGRGEVLEYNVFMDTLALSAKEFCLQPAICEAEVFSPIAPFTRRQCLRAKSAKMFESTMGSLFGHSFAVNNFWQSCKRLGESASQRGSRANVELGSFWDTLLHKVDNKIAQMRNPSPHADELHDNKRRRVRTKQTTLRTEPLPWPAPTLEMEDFPSSIYPAFSESAMVRNFELREVIGSGTFGTVYKAVRKASYAYVAVKIVNGGSSERADHVFEAHF